MVTIIDALVSTKVLILRVLLYIKWIKPFPPLQYQLNERHSFVY